MSDLLFLLTYFLKESIDDWFLAAKYALHPRFIGLDFSGMDLSDEDDDY